MTRSSRVGRRVRIKTSGGGMPEFHGKTGRIVSQEMGMYRVALDAPVEIPGIAPVRDDLWESCFLVNIR